MLEQNNMFKDWFKTNGRFVGEAVGFTLLSLLCFCALQFAVRWYLFGKCTFRTFNYFKFVQKRRQKSRHVPDSQSLQVIPPNKKWRISNEVVSLIHSVISGIWALYVCGMYPKVVTEMNTFVHETPLALIYLSFGYILHDLIDLLINERSIRILELLFHHVIVICAFLTTLTTSLFLGVVIFGLLMELNSIFLHTRSLMNLYGQPKNSTAFKFVALLNISTFIVFRMAVSVYLIYWQLTNAFTMKWYLIMLTFFIIVSLATTNTILLYRVLAADGLLGKKRGRTNNADSKKLHSIIDAEAGNSNKELKDEDENENENNDDDSSDFDYYTDAEVNFDNELAKKDKIFNEISNERRESVSAATQTDDISKNMNETKILIVNGNKLTQNINDSKVRLSSIKTVEIANNGVA